MIKKMTDEILDNPKDRDVKPKSADDAVNACKFTTHSLATLFLNFLILFSDSKLWQSHGAHNSRQCHLHFIRIRCHG